MTRTPAFRVPVYVALFVLGLCPGMGCYSTHRFLVTEKQQIKESQKISGVETLDGRVLEFDSDPLGYAVMRDTTIDRFKEDGLIESIPLSSVRIIHTTQHDPAATVLGDALGAGAAVFLVLAAFGHGMPAGFH